MPGHRGGSSHFGERDCHTEKLSKPVIVVSPGCISSVSQEVAPARQAAHLGSSEVVECAGLQIDEKQTNTETEEQKRENRVRVHFCLRFNRRLESF